MKYLILVFLVITTNSKTQLELTNKKSCTTCKEKYPNNISHDELVVKYDHYEFEYESDARNDLERRLKKKGYYGFYYQTYWDIATSGPGKKYKDCWHRNMQFMFYRDKKEKEIKVTDCPSLLKVKACIVESSIELDDFYGWIDTKGYNLR